MTAPPDGHPAAMPTTAQLVADLADRADITPTVEGSTPGWSITRYDRRDFNPAVLLVCSDEDLAAYLEATGEDAVDVFPEVPARVGAYRLLLVHLEEAFLSMTPPTAIAVTADGVQKLSDVSPKEPPTRRQKRLARGRTWVGDPARDSVETDRE